VAADIVERARESCRRQRTRVARADHFAAEAEAAIDRADVHQLQQHAVGIAVHDAFDRAVRVVADRIGALLRMRMQFAAIGNELPCDRIVFVRCIDQISHGRSHGQRIARSDSLDLRGPVG
jgi:hypothetical protein